MMITRKKILYSLFTMLLMSSCSWLEVAPSNQVNEDDLFSKGDGYRNALNGIYLKLSDAPLYGKNLSWGIVEVLGQQYLPDFFDRTETYYKASQYKYDDKDVKSVISTIWSSGYNGIASCNNLLRQVSESDPAFFVEGEMERSLIWGETLALRALFHFEMLRMFAPSMEVNDGKRYIPYVDSYPVISTTYYTNAEILQKIEADLLKARDLVAVCDIEKHPVWMETGYRMFADGLSDELPEELFFAYRGYRMNYYAITALLARIYLWEKEYKKAFDAAEIVANASYNETKLFEFVKSTELKDDMKDSGSLIFVTSDITLQEDFKPYTLSSSKNQFLFDGNAVYEIPANLDNPTKPKEIEDQRATGSMLGMVNGVHFSKKYLIEGESTGYDMVPVLRLSEMYYIMAEYYARNSNFKDAGKMLDVVREARGIISKPSNILSLEHFYSELLKEIRKELMGEGQLYFQYKRLDQKSFATDVKFVFDRPTDEDI